MKCKKALLTKAFAGLAIAASSAVFSQSPSFVAFESASVRPMVMSSDGNKLYVTNTPDNIIEVFDVAANGDLSASGSIPVGLEPVAVAVNGNDLWVVNHLSDSISVVDTATNAVKRTLLVGDEPRDIVFAQGKAFITTAHRGQHRTHPSIASAFDDNNGDPELYTPSTPRSDVWVFNAASLGSELGGKPVKVIEMFGDTPRALAVSPDGNTVYAAVFNSGNQTSIVNSSAMCWGFEDTPAGGGFNPSRNGDSTLQDRAGNEACIVGGIPAADASSSPNGLPGKQLPMGRPLPSTSASGENQPWEGLIVKFDRASGQWKDSRGLNYSNGIRFFLPDHDVFAINANTLNQTNDFEHVGTTLFNMAVNPRTGKIYVANQDANNSTRFEGPGIRGGSTVQGNIAKARITVIDPASGAVTPRHLNTHIDYSVLKAPASVKQHTISTPMEMQVSSDGNKLYVAALGSNKVAVYDTAALENGTINPALASANHINMPGGPQGVLLNEADNRLYVLTRFDNSVKVVNTTNGDIVDTEQMYNPEPANLQAGRFMLYDANRTSSNGESACAACHVFGDMDHLTWNLGNPDEPNGNNTNPFPAKNIATLACDLAGEFDAGCYLEGLLNGNGNPTTFAALKGPMNTQTMRGMSTMGHMHWRGDRVSGYFGSQDGTNFKTPDEMEQLDERLSFKNFIVAFEGLLGMDVHLEGGVNAGNKSAKRVALENDVDKFADFMLSVQLPPNPIRPLDNSHSALAQVGDGFFDGPRRSDGLENDTAQNGPSPDGHTCQECHIHDNSRGFYGGDGRVSTGGEFQILKVPHFRNLYQKVGMFGLPHRDGTLPSINDAHQGDQVRGFGFLHDGATDDLFNFLGGQVFDNGDQTCAQTGVPDWAGCSFNDGQSVGIPNDNVRRGLVQYLMEFDGDLAPVVGQQMTITSGASLDQLNRLSFLEQRAGVPFVSKVMGGNVTECDLVARGAVNGEQRGYFYQSASSSYRTDSSDDPDLSADQIRALAQADGNSLTFTCTPPGSGLRVALDRDLDGVLNCNEEGKSCKNSGGNGGGGGPTTVTLQSIAAEDGYIRSNYYGNRGAGVTAGNSGAFSLRVGDDAGNRHYASIVSFNLADIPANATITSAELTLKNGATNGTPLATYGDVTVDLAAPHFGSSAALQNADYQAGSDVANAATISTAGPVTVSLTEAARNAMGGKNKVQLRMYFNVQSGVNDRAVDQLGWFAGNAANASLRPKLKIEYTTP